MKKSFKSTIEIAFEKMLEEQDTLSIITKFKKEDEKETSIKNQAVRRKRKTGNIKEDSASYSGKRERSKKKS